MRLCNLNGRLTTFVDGRPVDVERASGGRLGADPQAAYQRWEELVAWGLETGARGGGDTGAGELGPPVPSPRQLFAVGLSYRDHAEEVGMPLTGTPTTFTKFQSCLTGPDAVVELFSDTVDWEVELVVVLAHEAYQVAASGATSHVAGYTIGQDLSERTRQMAGSPAQFSLAKSYPGYGPTGPWVVTLDELVAAGLDPDDLAISCHVDGRVRQKSRTSQLLFPVAEVIAELSSVCRLFPGDLIFTGTPAGVGMAQKPPNYLRSGDEIVSAIEGIGMLVTRMRDPDSR